MIYLLLLLGSFQVFSLTEKEIIHSVVTHFPLIDEALMKYEASKADLTASEGAFDHKLMFKSRNRIEDKYDNQYFETSIERLTPYYGLGLIAGHRQGRGNFPAYDGKNETSGAGEIFAGISLPLLRNFSTDQARTNLEISKLERDQAKSQLELKKNMYVHKALSLYYKWLLENQKLKIRKSILAQAQDRHKMLEKKFQAGDVERLKINDNQRSIDKRKDEILSSEINVSRLKTELALYLRAEDGSPLELNQTLYPDESLITLNSKTTTFDLNTVPQFTILEFERKKLKVMETLYDQARRPGLNLELIGARELSGNPAYDPDSLQVGMKFDFPLENRSAKGKSVSAMYKVKAIEKQRDYLTQELTRFYHFSREAMQDSKKRWEVTSNELKNSLKMSQAETRRWQQGASDLFLVYLREQEVAETEIRRWTTLYEYLQYSLDARLFSGTIISK